MACPHATLSGVNVERNSLPHRPYAIWFLYGSVSASLFLLLSAPHAGAFLGAEDGFIENISALLFFVAAIIAAVKGVRNSRVKKSSYLATSTFFGLSVLFFVFAGEEISWGQRIFGFETSEFLQANNWQGEINFHNLQTDVFNVLYHYGAFLFLVALPLLRKQIHTLFDAYNLAAVKRFIAPTWLGLTMLAFIGMLDPRFIYAIEKPWAAILYLFILLLGLLFIGIRLVRSVKLHNHFETRLLVVSTSLIVCGLLVSYYQAIDFSPNAISEYKEMVIALGLFIYTFQLKTQS